MLFQTVQTGESLFWQGLVFTGLALALTLSAIWYLYLSPIKQPSNIKAEISDRFIITIALITGISSIIRLLGAHWDTSEHVIQGVVPGGSDFLWPPHLMLYTSFVISFIVALYATLRITAPYRRKRIFDPRPAIRDYPYIGAIVIAALYGWISVPGDAIWHEIYGFDLTAWSPPHVMLMIASATEPLCAAGLLMMTRRKSSGVNWRDVVVLIFLGAALQMFNIIGVLDWEIPGGRASEIGSRMVDARATWLYPVISAGITLFVINFAKRLNGFRWGATLAVLFSYGVRLVSMGFVTLLGGVTLKFPLIALLGALLFDLLPLEKVASPFVRTLIQSLAYITGFMLLVPLGIGSVQKLYGFTTVDYTLTVLIGVAASLIILPFSRAAAGWFLRQVEPVRTAS